MTYKDSDVTDTINRLNNCRSMLRANLKKIDDITALFYDIKTVIEKPATREQRLVGNKIELIDIPAVTKIPIDKRTGKEITSQDRNKIFDYAVAEADVLCSHLESL